MKPRNQMLPLLRGIRKKLRKSSSLVREGKMSLQEWETLWESWYSMLKKCHEARLVTDIGYDWLQVREHVMDENYGCG